MKNTTAHMRAKPIKPVSRKKPAPPKQNLITCAEVERLYDGRWVIMEILKLDRSQQPEAGIVVFSANKEEELFALSKNLIHENPKRKYYLFYAGDPSLAPDYPGVILHVAVAH